MSRPPRSWRRNRRRGERGAQPVRHRDGGKVATILAPDGSLDSLYQRNQTLYGIFLTRERARFTEMAPVFERGPARPRIGKVLRLDQIAEAHRLLDAGHNSGKIVIDIN
ncbi:zinc-binding dehydrogenase [Nocardia salmonicida]|uniref:zinc-binding dehydrogenase n=1 Tax=Nocardia salmonicida TaxID=53431 RepID=UPI002E29B79C|nr:zinc-binding dehydrogenase [Nocardia salmonicida]